MNYSAKMFLVTLGLAAVCARVPGQERGVRLADQTLLQEKRIALVVGNTKYARGPLKNPANDARAMAARLEQLGFSVDLVLDANRTQFDHALTNFRHRLSQEAVGLFYLPVTDCRLKEETISCRWTSAGKTK